LKQGADRVETAIIAFPDCAMAGAKVRSFAEKVHKTPAFVALKLLASMVSQRIISFGNCVMVCGRRIS